MNIEEGSEVGRTPAPKTVHILSTTIVYTSGYQYIQDMPRIGGGFQLHSFSTILRYDCKIGAHLLANLQRKQQDFNKSLVQKRYDIYNSIFIHLF